MKSMERILITKINFLILKNISLVNAGFFSEDIENLMTSIPQQHKNRDFEEKVFYFRLTSFDVPFICNNVSKMLTTQENLILQKNSRSMQTYSEKRGRRNVGALEF